MSQPNPERKSQKQENIVRDTTVSGNFTFAPQQIETYIETQIVEISAEKVTQQSLIKSSPYKGLKRFNFGDREYFFGRDALIAKLFKAVNKSNFSLVLGASGSGKSSVIRAGLIPELKKSLESNKFYDFIFTPDEDPFDSLFVCLRNREKGYSFSKSEASIALKAKADTLSEVIKKLKKEDEKWLIFVDQFEQLFTICTDIEKQKNFIEGIVRVAKTGDSSVRIILAMRSDFLEQFSFYPTLAAIADQNNIHLVTEMHPDELRQAIEQPAAKHGVVFETGLVEQIIKEVEGQSGYLPLLQYTLDLLWEKECTTKASDGRFHIEDRTLNKISYQTLKGVRGALQERVDEIYRDICKKSKDGELATKQIFLKLVNIVESDSGSRAVSRKAYRYEFVGEPLENILKRFIDENLLVSSYEYLSVEELSLEDGAKPIQNATLEIAHEILLSSWDKLKRWLEEEKEAIILKNWLAGETRRWLKVRAEDESKANDELLKGSRLDQIVEFREKNAFEKLGGLVKEENQFINASVDWRDLLEQEKKERERRELEDKVALETAEKKNQILAKANQEAKHRILIGSVILAISLVGAAIAVVRAIVAFQEQQEAQAVTKLERAGVTARRQFESQQLEALITAMQAGIELKDIVVNKGISLSEYQKYPTISPMSALKTILDNIQESNRIKPKEDVVSRGVSFGPDGKRLLTIGWADNKVHFWELSGKPIRSFDTAHQDRIGDISVNRDGIIATLGADGKVHLWNLSGQSIDNFDPLKYETPIDSLKSLSFSPEGDLIAISDLRRLLRVWMIQEQKFQFRKNLFVRQAPTRVSFGPSGLLAVATDDGTVHLLSVIDRKKRRKFNTNQGQLQGISFSRDGILATGGEDRTVRLWKIDEKEEKQIAKFPTKQGMIVGLSFSPDGKQLAAAEDFGVVRLWTLVNDSGIKSFDAGSELKLNNKRLRGVSFSPDGKLVVASEEGIISRWTVTGNLINKFNPKEGNPEKEKDQVVGISHSSRSQQLAIHYLQEEPFGGSYVILCSVTGICNPQFSTRAIHNGYGISVSPKGDKIATSDGFGGVSLFTPNGEILKTINISEIHRIKTWGLDFSPDGQQLAIAGENGIVSFWSPTEGKLIKQFNTGHSIVYALSFSPDGPSGKQLATAGDDGIVRLWTLDGELITEFQSSQSRVYGLSFSPDGKQLVTVGDDGIVRLYPIQNLDELLQRGCNWLRGYLTYNVDAKEQYSVLRQKCSITNQSGTK